MFLLRPAGTRGTSSRGEVAGLRWWGVRRRCGACSNRTRPSRWHRVPTRAPWCVCPGSRMSVVPVAVGPWPSCFRVRSLPPCLPRRTGPAWRRATKPSRCAVGRAAWRPEPPRRRSQRPSSRAQRTPTIPLRRGRCPWRERSAGQSRVSRSAEASAASSRARSRTGTPPRCAAQPAPPGARSRSGSDQGRAGPGSRPRAVPWELDTIVLEAVGGARRRHRRPVPGQEGVVADGMLTGQAGLDQGREQQLQHRELTGPRRSFGTPPPPR